MQVKGKLCQIAKTSTENTKATEKLADRVDDFAYDLLDQVKRIEEKELLDEAVDRYASLFSEMTAKAIAKGQKKEHFNFNFNTYSGYAPIECICCIQKPTGNKIDQYPRYLE